jgi:8-oxo-dGTP diphosphatase
MPELSSTGRPVVEVAVGVLCDSTDSILLGQRPDGKPYAGYWEFPGGKVEAGESVFQALFRELAEEIGIQIQDALEFMVIEHDYPHAYVRLHVCLVKKWDGQIKSLESQALHWITKSQIIEGILPVSPVLPAASPMLDKLRELFNA